MPTRAEQAQAELRRRGAQAELERRGVRPDVSTFPGGEGGQFGGRGATGGWEPAPEPKTWGEVVTHGYRRAGTMMVKQLAGLTKMAGEFIDPSEKAMERAVFPALNRFEQRQAGKLKEWSNMMLGGVEKYYDENPQEAIQVAPNLGYLKTLNEYVTKPKNLVQGLIESAPMMLEATLGTVTGGAIVGVPAMAVPISGEVYASARKEGTEPLPAIAQAILTGTGEAIIEQWTFSRKLGLAKNFRKMVAGGLPKVLWEGTKAFFRGTAEEGTQEFNRNFWQWVFTDRSQAWMENVAESAAAGGPMEMVMAGGFSAAGATGTMVSNAHKMQRIEKIRATVNESEELSGQHKAEIGKELDVVVEDVERGELEVAPTVEPEAKPVVEVGVEEVYTPESIAVRKEWQETQIRTGKVVDMTKAPALVPITEAKPAIEPAPVVGEPITKTEKDALREKGYSVPGILKMDPTEARSVLGIEEAPAKPKPPHLTRRRALKLGHSLPDALDWSEAQRRDFMQQTVGKPSMKNMSLAEMRTVVEAMQNEMRAAGLEYIPKPSPVDELVAGLEEAKKITEPTAKEELRRGRVRSLGRKIKSGAYSFVTGLERMERFFESLDAHKEGVFYKTIWEPVKNADELSTENANQDLAEFTEYLADQNIDTALWLGKVEEVGNTGWNLSPFQKIGVYTLSLNKNGRRQLIEGMGFSESDLAQVIDSMAPQEKATADWLLEKYDQQWAVLKQVAAQSGLDPAKLKKELHYSPIIRTDADLETQEDFLSGLSNAFTGETYDPEHKFLEPRKPGARGKVELDAAIMYMHNIARTQRFLQMAPVANNIGRVLNNREFKAALNERTYGQGSKLINKWMKDAVRGTVSQSYTQLSKAANIMRRNGIVYAIGYNIPSSLRQSLSLSNAMAVDKAMLRHVPANLARAIIPKQYKQMQEFVYARSLQVKNASFDRDLRTKANKAGIKLRLRGKRQWSQKAISWIRWMDRHTRVVAWKSLYDTGMGKFNNEQKAISYADKWVARTQPMASMKDLPHFFRGGTFEKLLTTFQNQVNNNANFYIYDILGAKKAGEISLTEAGHRVMFSYVLPAVLFGMIGRGGPPRDIKDVIVDLVTYPIAGVVVLGRWITAMIRGWGNSSTIAEAGPEELGKLVGAVKRGDIFDIIKFATTTIGALTGRIPAQAVRTAEGAMDLARGTTEDPRRLIWSEWALSQGEKEKKKARYGGGYILP